MTPERIATAVKYYEAVSVIWVYAHFLAFVPTLYLFGMYGWKGLVASALLAGPKLLEVARSSDKIRSFVKQVFQGQGAF